MRRTVVVYCAILVGTGLSTYALMAGLAGYNKNGPVVQAASRITQGSLQMVDPEGNSRGSCPLKHTDVKAEISGFLARVVVTQEFQNPLDEKIEAVYTFPLPQDAAVDSMVMRVGDRTVRGKIKPREEARAIYDQARSSGRVASLLDQERPNIFTQSVANILPGEAVMVIISYVERLKYEDGSYQFVFPMVVGPRYIPGNATGKQAGGWAPDTNRVPDASRITPQLAPEGTRAGHDISLEVTLDAGVPLDDLRVLLHEADVDRPTNHSAIVRLKSRTTIPNKDFILKYDVAGRQIEDAVLTHRSERGGFFTMIVQPPERVTVADVTPKELVFVLDTSGSMMGFPIEKAKETMKLALDALNPRDTFNLITFAGDTQILFPQPVSATAQNIRKAQQFLESRNGGGGTEMMKAIRAALDPSDSQDHVRVVCFMTDGYVGNDMEIISEIQKHANARVFAFGIGNSVNRFLLDKMAEHGRGEVEYVTLSDDGSAAARRFHERVRNPLLTDISIDWSGLPVADTYPKRIPDLFSAKPVVLCGRFTGAARGVFRISGKVAGRDFVKEVPVEFPESDRRHDVLATLWARTRIEDLMSQDYAGAQAGAMRPELRETVTQLGLEYNLMTQFTSFVAVEEMVVTDGGQPRRIDVPVEMPEGVSREGVFGSDKEEQVLQYRASRGASLNPTGIAAGRAGGAGGGSGDVRSSPKPTTEQLKRSYPSTGTVSAPAAEKTRRADANEPEPADDAKQREVMTKLHPAVLAIVERLKRNDRAAASGESSFVTDGKAEVQIWLTGKSKQVIDQLRQLGFELVLDPKTSNLVIGRVPIEKLEALSRLNAVRYVAPQTK
ncbi:MAG TPA: VIT and VWA domain-containing protein [Blastocatellia bacterium]|nr:VIT and VWA domain-containing protein [Blastocatellia bacterium]